MPNPDSYEIGVNWNDDGSTFVVPVIAFAICGEITYNASPIVDSLIGEPHVPKGSRSSDDKDQQEMEAILEKALKEPGVTEAVEVYEKAEFVAAAVANATWPSEFTTNSTNDEPRV